jgi:membrane fusion protein, multidrug efflux system
VITRGLRYWLILAILLSAGGQWSCSNSKGDVSRNGSSSGFDDLLVVKAVPADARDWIATVPVSGSLRTLSTVDVKPEVGGRLIAVYFQEGDLIRKDQLLAEIDPVNYQLAYDQAAATLAVAQAGLERARISAEHARTEKERADNLLRTGGITQKDHQAATTAIKDADSQVRLAEAQCGQARAALAIAEKALKDCKIFSPAQGHVQKRHFDKGSLLAPGVPLCTLVDNSQLELECVVPSYQLASLRLGQRAEFTTPTWGERMFEGVVSAINPAVESDNRSVKVKLKIANPGGELRSGMYGRGEITTGHEKNAVVIPRDSLIPEKEDSDLAGVFVVRDGKAHRVNIQVGGAQQGVIWVRNGLSLGDLVITEIGPSLKEGIPVRVLKSESTQ